MLGNYLFVEELVAANVPGSHAARAVSLPELQSSQDYAYSIQAQDSWPASNGSQPNHVFITQYLPEGPQTSHTGYWLPLTVPLPRLNPLAQFREYNLTTATAEACHGETDITLHWLPHSESDCRDNIDFCAGAGRRRPFANASRRATFGHSSQFAGSQTELAAG